MAIAIYKGNLHHFSTEKNNFFHFFFAKTRKSASENVFK